MSREKKARVYRARIVSPTEPYLTANTISQRVLNAITPGSRAESYGRTWIIGQTDVNNDKVITGRIGFESDPDTTEVWNEETTNFHEIAVPAGYTAPFAVNVESLELWVQPRSSMTPGGVFRAFEKLLGLEGEKWVVEPDQPKLSLESWKKSVDRITKVKLVVKKPNPHYRGTPNLEALLEDSDSEVARLELMSDDGIDTEAPFLEETQRHVDAGYGDGEYTGERDSPSGGVVQTKYRTSVGTEEDGISVEVAGDGEVQPDQMRRIASNYEEVELNGIRRAGPKAD